MECVHSPEKAVQCYSVILMLFAMVAVHPLNGQNLHDGTWLLGRLPNKPEIFSGGSLLDFTHRPMIARYVPVGGGSSVSYQPVSDQRGHLLFYTNGCAIYNQFHTLVENGDGLNPGWYRDRYCDESKLGYVVDQGLAFIPKTDTNQYILYHTLVADTGGFPLVYQTEIERTEDGTGRVTKKNDPVLHGYLDGGGTCPTRQRAGLVDSGHSPDYRRTGKFCYPVTVHPGGDAQCEYPETLEGAMEAHRRFFLPMAAIFAIILAFPCGCTILTGAGVRFPIREPGRRFPAPFHYRWVGLLFHPILSIYTSVPVQPSINTI